MHSEFKDLPTEPGKRKYRLYFRVGPAPDDWEEQWIDEKDLTPENKKALATEIINWFMYMPDEVQDMFMNWQDAMILQAKQLQADGKVIPINSPLIIPGRS